MRGEELGETAPQRNWTVWLVQSGLDQDQRSAEGSKFSHTKGQAGLRELGRLVPKENDQQFFDRFNTTYDEAERYVAPRFLSSEEPAGGTGYMRRSKASVMHGYSTGTSAGGFTHLLNPSTLFFSAPDEDVFAWHPEH